MINGILNIYKEKGYTSHDVVARLRGIVGQKKIGHTGTLDPDAEGVLPVCLGRATKVCDMLTDKDKTYEAVLLLGKTTDTQDITGTVLSERSPDGVTEDEVLDCIRHFIGEYDQMPPAYSAKSVNGVRAYMLARQGKEVTLTPKRVRVDALELLGEEREGIFSVRIVCGGGTYIRSLARDIAAQCGTVGYMAALVRERSGPFLLEKSIPPDALTKENWRSFLIPPDAVLDLPRLDLADAEAARCKNGVPVPSSAADGLYKLYLDGAFYGTAQVQQGKARARTKLV